MFDLRMNIISPRIVPLNISLTKIKRIVQYILQNCRIKLETIHQHFV